MSRAWINHLWLIYWSFYQNNILQALVKLSLKLDPIQHLHGWKLETLIYFSKVGYAYLYFLKLLICLNNFNFLNSQLKSSIICPNVTCNDAIVTQYPMKVVVMLVWSCCISHKCDHTSINTRCARHDQENHYLHNWCDLCRINFSWNCEYTQLHSIIVLSLWKMSASRQKLVCALIVLGGVAF